MIGDWRTRTHRKRQTKTDGPKQEKIWMMCKVESWFAATMKSKSTFFLCPVARRDQRCPLVASCHTESVWQQWKSPNSLQKCQSGDAGWQEDPNVRVEGQKRSKWTIYRWKKILFFHVTERTWWNLCCVLQSKVNWPEPGAALQAWLRYLQQILNRGASSLRISAHPWPGSRPQMAVRFWLLLWSLPGIPYLITIASVIWVQLLLSLLLSWWQPHMSSSLCFWQEFVMGPYLCVNISVCRRDGVCDYW